MFRSFRLRSARETIIFCCFIFLLWLQFRDNEEDLDSLVDAEDRADYIRDAFLFGWDGYKTHAFPHDTLLPLTDSFYDDR